jgi:hypothetical protein
MTSLERVAAYLASVPGGIDAYPDCLHKGEPLAVWLERSPLDGLAERVPPAVARLLRAPRDLPQWVPEVHATVIYLAMREVHFQDDASFLAHARRCNQSVLETPLNQVLFWAASPRAILRAGPVRWGSMHRGSTITVRSPDEHSGELTMAFPENLFPEIVVRGNGTGCALAIERAGGRAPEIHLREMSPTRAVLEARWR